MKNRLLTLLLLFVAATVVGQTEPRDKTKLLGTWHIYEIVTDGAPVMSMDPIKQQKIINDAWAKDSVVMQEIGMDKALLSKNMDDQSLMLSNMIFVFYENGTVSVLSSDDKLKDVVSPYIINQKKKRLTINEKNKDKLTYTYTISVDQLTLKQKNDVLIFKRKA
ncbi:MAG: hypothetical protein V4604_17455 [Bacteroidota bacterium]